MIKNEIVKFKEMEIMEVDFMGDEITVVKMKGNGKLYVGLKWIAQTNIGLSDGQWQSYTRKIQEDLVLSKGIANLQLPTKGGNQKALCCELDYLPLMLAKISITPNMKNEHPEIAEKLINYQLKVKDILVDIFFGKKESWDKQRFLAKHDRVKMTDKIKDVMGSPSGYVYSGFTDLVYEILFNKKAKQMRIEKGLTKPSQYTRDYLSEQELTLVDEAETIVTALVALGFKYDYIKYQLQQKYTKQIQG